MDEEVGVVAPGVRSQVVFKTADLAVYIVAMLAVHGGSCLWRRFQLFRYCCRCSFDYFVLRVVLTILSAFASRQRPEFKGNKDCVAADVPYSLRDAGYEESPLPIHFVLPHFCVIQTEVHRNTVGRNPVVVAEMLVALDVVLVTVCPVEIDFLARCKGWRTAGYESTGA